jgi:hypothetical protein
MDIVEWLRKEAELVALDRLGEAADEIERLRGALRETHANFGSLEELVIQLRRRLAEHFSESDDDG